MYAGEYAIHFHYTEVWEDEEFTHLCIVHCNKKEIKEAIKKTIKNLSDEYTKVKLIRIERRK